MADQNTNVAIPSGFMSKMLDSMPRFVTGLIGSFLGVAIAVVIVLKLGGLDNVVIRIANSYAAGLEASMAKLATETDKLADISAKFEAINAELTSVNGRLAQAEVIAKDAQNRAQNALHQGTALADTVSGMQRDMELQNGKVNRLLDWACGHEKRVAKPAEFTSSACR